jgi:hypothetical protein
MSTSKKNDVFNGVNTQTLNKVYNVLQNQPEMAKATFYVKSEWNGGFSVTSSSKGFRVGGQNIERNPEEYKMQYDFPNQLSGQGKGLLYGQLSSMLSTITEFRMDSYFLLLLYIICLFQ